VICFDTDVLSVFFSQGASPAAQRRLAAVPADEQFTTSISLGELLYGAEKRQSSSLRRAIEDFLLGSMRVLAFEERAAWVYAEIRARLEREGQRLDEPDLRIAAIALSRDLTLVTGNIRHFARVPNLQVENWLE
jgi:tRNA(fMet)-specific endonuclease VapC